MGKQKLILLIINVVGGAAVIGSLLLRVPHLRAGRDHLGGLVQVAREDPV